MRANPLCGTWKPLTYRIFMAASVVALAATWGPSTREARAQEDGNPFGAQAAAAPAAPMNPPQAQPANAPEIQPRFEFFPVPTKREITILTELDHPTEMDFTDTPLQDAVDYLKDYHQLEIQLDERSLEEVGVGTDTPITRKVKGLSLRAALNLTLAALELDYLVKDEVLLITTKDMASMTLVTRTYPVGDLADQQDYDSLVKAITMTVVPQSWHESGGPGAAVVVKSAKSLVISQTRDGHDEIVKLLRALRAAQAVGAPAKR